MIGRSAFSIRHTAQVLFDDFAMRRASLDLLSAWSAIEIALVGHRRQARQPAAVQPARRRLARTGEGLCQWLVQRQRNDRGRTWSAR